MNDQLATETPPSAAPKPRRIISPWIYDILLIYILLVGAFFRLVGLNWGEYQYLHPDERFLVWVGSDIQPVGTQQELLGTPPNVQDQSWRASFPNEFPDCKQWGGYFDASCSPLNPNNKGHSFYVYGTLPMFLARYIVQWVYGHSGFEEMTNVGRALSALVDWLTVLLVYLVAARNYNKRVALLAAAFTACCVMQIQLSHYFTMDTFANFFTLLAIYYAVRVSVEKGQAPDSQSVSSDPSLDPTPEVRIARSVLAFFKHPYFLLSLGFGVALGCAVASKLNAVPVAAMLPAAFGLVILRTPPEERPKWLGQAFVYLVLAAGVSVLVFRILQPYAFMGPGFFGLKPNPQWLANIKEQRNQAAGDVDFPPALQWARRPITFSLQNLVVWGMGLPLGLLAWAGFAWAAWRIWKKDWTQHILLLGWTAVYFIWQTLQFNPTMRYQLPIYPTLAIFAAWAVVTLYDRRRQADLKGWLKRVRPAVLRWAVIIIGGAVLVATCAYAFAFSRIYVRPITRVEASYWIYQNIPGPINLPIQETSRVFNQILPFPYSYSLSPDVPYTTAFTAREAGTLSEVYLAHVVDSHASGFPANLTLVLSTQPNGEQPLSAFTVTVTPLAGESGAGQVYALQINPPLEVTQDTAYYLTLLVAEGEKPLYVCGPFTASIQTGGTALDQTLPGPKQCTIRAEFPYSVAFTAIGSGSISQVTLGQQEDQSASGGPSTLRLSLSTGGEDTVVAQASVTSDFLAGDNGLGAGYTLTLDRPVELVKDQSYRLTLTMDAGSGSIALQGSGLANEGDWDDGLPLRVDNYDAFGGVYPNGLNFNMYWDDNQEKLERFLRIYDQSDYIVITSNRQWGTLTRLPERFPMSTLHYRHLLGCPADKDIIWCYRVAQPGMFKGDLGFELVKVFQSDPSIGPLSINDQFAEEAFTVYDHPKVLIFRKTADYDPQRARQILESADLEHIVHVTPKKAKSYPGNLMLPEERLAEQQSGGTWLQLFNTQALLNRFEPLGVVVWYLSVFLLGLLAYPLLRLALPGLPDHGYPLARTAGMLLFSYLAWLGGSMRIPVTRLMLSGVLLLLAILATYLAYRQRDELRQEWSGRKKYFLIIEALTLAFFLFFLLIRFGNPDLWQQWKGGEKPMDFSYFNAVLKSTTFPPYDPWYAGGYLNYYYYGFVFVGMLVKLLGIIPSFAYNLIIPTLFSMVAMGAFSLGYNLSHPQPSKEEELPAIEAPPDGASFGDETSTGEALTPDPPAPAEPRFAAYRPYIVGAAAALGIAVLGNLGTLRMILRGFEMVGLPGGLTDSTGFFTRLGGLVAGVWKVIAGGQSLPYNLGDWYWIPSRAIPAPGDTEPITEFPMFTFLYADLHAHMIALAIALLVLTWALAVVMGRGKWQSWGAGVLGFFIGGLAIGAMYPTNLSDIYTYLPLAVAALVYSWWRYWEVGPGTFKGTILENIPTALKRLLIVLAGVVVLSALAFWLFQPYRAWYGQGYTQLGLWKGTHTPTGSYLVHWGLFLFVIISWMIWEVREWMAHTPLSSLRKLASYQGLIYGGIVLLLGWVGLLLWMKAYIAWLVLPLAAWAGLLLLRPKLEDCKRLVLFWVGTSLVVMLMVEVVVVRGDIGRMNTVFKFYLQAWTLLAVSMAAAFGWLLEAMPRWKSYWRTSWKAVLICLAASAALFAIFASLAKIKDRMTYYEQYRLDPGVSAPHTLDGMDYMKYAKYYEDGPNGTLGMDMDLSQDYAAIRWMQENVQGSPVIVEANSRNLYRWYSRFTIYTGLPGVVGWEWHQQQQRALNPSDWVTARVLEIGEFYTTIETGKVKSFLNKYDVGYIIVGQLERVTYPGPGLDKFNDFNGVLWREVYRQGDTVIYQVIK